MHITWLLDEERHTLPPSSSTPEANRRKEEVTTAAARGTQRRTCYALRDMTEACGIHNFVKTKMLRSCLGEHFSLFHEMFSFIPFFPLPPSPILLSILVFSIFYSSLPALLCCVMVRLFLLMCISVLVAASNLSSSLVIMQYGIR